jgi:hypothetical protein
MNKHTYIYCLLILTLGLFIDCNNDRQYKFHRINSCDIKVSYISDTSGQIIDTLPMWLKKIKHFSFNNIDTSHVLLSDSKTALDFARKRLDSIYGIEEMNSEEPFNIDLIDNKFWYITGTLDNNHLQCGGTVYGGVAEIMISKYNGEILFLIHGK